MVVATTATDFSKLRKSGMTEGFGTSDPVLLDGPRGLVAPYGAVRPVRACAPSLTIINQVFSFVQSKIDWHVPCSFVPHE
jgi:hypothetical protein